MVDDSTYGSYISYYEDSLNHNYYPYNLWNPDLRGYIDSSTINSFKLCIWSTPFGGPDSYEQSVLREFLDNGGRLFISGQDIGYSIGSTSFYSNYLHAQYVNDNVNLYNLNGVLGDPITNNINISIAGGDGANNQWWPSEINPIIPAASIFHYNEFSILSNENFTLQELPLPLKENINKSINYTTSGISSSGTGALRVDTGTYRVVYLAFGFEAINSSADRDILMNKIVSRLVGTGPVHNINKGTNYTSIQAAINDASPGDEIHVDSGTYYEDVNVNKRLTLRGIGMPVVDANRSGSAITLAADGSTLDGFTATNAEAGIKVISNNNTLCGNNASNNDYGVYLSSSHNNTLNGNNALEQSWINLNFSNFNNITNNNISNSTSVGIKVYDTSTNNTISRNKISNSNSGMFFVYAFNTTASNNIMENNSFNFGVGGNLQSHFEGNYIDTSNLANGRPIYYVKHGKNTTYDSSTKASTFYCILCNNVTVKDLEMSNMDRGVYFWETSNSRIQNITVKESGWGIYMRQSPNNTIKDSKFSTNNQQDYSETGVTLYSSNNNTFENNTFISNNYGIELYSSSKNTIYNNYFNNTNNFVFRGTPYVNAWNVTKNLGTNIIGGSYLGGNFWANPAGKDFSQTCLDSNIDGLCDSKYSLNGNNSDYLPLKYKSALGITVVSPNGGENWTRGTTKTINWTSMGSPGSYVKIELLKPGVANKVIILSTPNDGSHPWPISATQAPGTDYKIKITSTTNAAYTDTSDNTFTIPTPNITIITPNGGETWRRGTTQTIKWNSSGSPGAYVKIELLKAGVLNRVIIASTLNDGSNPWLIPPTQAPGTDYMVRITSTTNVAYNHTSDSSFTIPTPSFTVVSRMARRTG